MSLFASRDLDKVRAYAPRFGGAGIFDSYDEAIRSPDIDAVDICLPDRRARSASTSSSRSRPATPMAATPFT